MLLLKILLYGLPNECKLLQLVLLHAKYLTWLKYYATETNPVKLGRGKMMNYNNNNNTKKKKPSPQKRKNLTQGTITFVQKESENPDQPLEIPTQKHLSRLPN
jgi:hypothetical protein